MYMSQVGTYDVLSEKSPEQLPEEISNLAESLKLLNNRVVVPNIDLINN